MRFIEKVWFHPAKVYAPVYYGVLLLLMPFSLVFALLSVLRRALYKLKVLKQHKLTKPVIVVGNISVGGNGKTPMVLWLIAQCQQLGLTVGVISRGYGGKAKQYPLLLNQHTTPAQAGDEPVMIFQRTGVLVAVGADRVASATMLIDKGCDIIISDDGMQHYRLARDLELAIVDGKRGFGNSLLMPAGPLREGKKRLKQVDNIVVNGESSLNLARYNSVLNMQLSAQYVVNIISQQKVAINTFVAQHQQIQAIAGIGAPQRFFDMLKAQQFKLEQQQAFVDHHAYSVNDFTAFSENKPLLMTEKDAIKCRDFAKQNWWYVPVDAQFSSQQATSLLASIQQLTQKY